MAGVKLFSRAGRTGKHTLKVNIKSDSPARLPCQTVACRDVGMPGVTPIKILDWMPTPFQPQLSFNTTFVYIGEPHLYRDGCTGPKVCPHPSSPHSSQTRLAYRKYCIADLSQPNYCVQFNILYSKLVSAKLSVCYGNIE